MAKYENEFKADYHDFMQYLENDILKGSLSLSYEDGSDYTIDGVHVGVRVYERYSFTGKNRVSLNITVVSVNGMIHVSAITSGGSQAVFFKINRIGEGSFLRDFKYNVEDYIKKTQI